MSTEIADRRQVDYRALMKEVEGFVQELGRDEDVAATIRDAARQIVARFRHELGITGGRLYRREGKFYELQATFPEAKDLQGFRVPRGYPPIDRVLEEGTVFMTVEDPGVDRDLEAKLGTEEFAAIVVGDEEYILAFDVAPGPDPEEVLFSLGILRHTIDQKIRQERMAGLLAEARKIQAAILPRRPPDYGEFEIFGRTESMESVGGDFYDFIPITNKILGVAIADVSGHGLPAALQVRDIYTGLRMGMARDFKIVRTVEHLNSIIHESTLTSRFVSMVYGELELNGLFIYVNAGHPPPFVLRADGTVDRLSEGGAVLGPLPEATYERGFLTLRPGDVLVLYTDGFVEARGRRAEGAREEYGAERLVEVARQNREASAEVIVEAMFTDVKRFTGDLPQEDDRTVLVVRYPLGST